MIVLPLNFILAAFVSACSLKIPGRSINIPILKVRLYQIGGQYFLLLSAMIVTTVGFIPKRLSSSDMPCYDEYQAI